MLPESADDSAAGIDHGGGALPAPWSLRLDHAFDEIRDEDFRWADLVMVSSMHAQRVDTLDDSAPVRGRWERARSSADPGRRASPKRLQLDADHVLVGEAEEVFAAIAHDLEQGTARAIYRVADKPDMSRSPIPRFDLLRRDMYTSMPVQFSRGCPFQCEFCDIITIYGRKPRVKSPAQLIAELDTLRALGWRNEVFIVDDNFIGNSKNALQLSHELAEWGKRNNGRCSPSTPRPRSIWPTAPN